MAMCSDMAATIIMKNKQEQKHKMKKIQCTVQKEDSDWHTKKKELFKCLCINVGHNLIMGELQI
jgi:DNA repair protein RadC